MKKGKEILSVLGLPPMHGQVYLAALELGEATLQALSRKSGVNRSTIYTFIDELVERGYMTETRRGKRRVYGSVHPEHLLHVERERIKELERFLPELLAINNNSRQKPRVTFYEGYQGIEEVYADMLRERKEIVAYEDLEHLRRDLPDRIFTWFPKERAARDILIRSVSRDTAFAREFTKRNRGLLRETKFVEAGDFRTDINIYGDKVALMNLRDNPFCVLIENKNLADTMRIMWKELWNRLGPAVE